MTNFYLLLAVVTGAGLAVQFVINARLRLLLGGPLWAAAVQFVIGLVLILVVALITRQELVLILVGGVFVIEALSVIGQVASFKVRRKRILRMAPIHHHFELLGWPEPQIIVRFWIVSVVCALLALSTLKLR